LSGTSFQYLIEFLTFYPGSSPASGGMAVDEYADFWLACPEFNGDVAPLGG
jgi:hypothetical protein